jgi:phenylpropionate dioxygenase-like ring-hydroxylating dioxygenase large terminal subunit
MLSKADNDLLTQTGPGTPMGDLFRRFWLPALLPSELPAPDCPPIRFRILSEDLVAFRDSDGRVGFFKEACPHRGASVFFGRNEEGGLRCVYHGWKFDVGGACVEMPSEPAESNFKSKVRIGAYAAAEYAGLVWIYMGPREKQPPLPKYQWTLQPEAENSRVTKHMQDSNYAQALEGNIDSAHVSFLHRTFGRLNLQNTDLDVGPLIQTKETDFGFVYGGRRTTPDDQYYWRITAYVWPTFTQIAGTSRNGNGIFVIPMDDEHLWWFNVAPPNQAPRVFNPNGADLTGEGGPFDKSTFGLEPGSFRYIRNKDNDYMISREAQRNYNYTGLPGNRIQDSMVTESMGPIYDRSREHLGTTDRAVIYMRRMLIDMARQLQQGIEPAILADPMKFRAIPMNAVTSDEDMAPVWDPYWADFLSEEPSATLLETLT